MRSYPYRALNYAHSADERERLSILIAAPIIKSVARYRVVVALSGRGRQRPPGVIFLRPGL